MSRAFILRPLEFSFDRCAPSFNDHFHRRRIRCELNREASYPCAFIDTISTLTNIENVCAWRQLDCSKFVGTFEERIWIPACRTSRGESTSGKWSGHDDRSGRIDFSHEWRFRQQRMNIRPQEKFNRLQWNWSAICRK